MVFGFGGKEQPSNPEIICTVAEVNKMTEKSYSFQSFSWSTPLNIQEATINMLHASILLCSQFKCFSSQDRSSLFSSIFTKIFCI